MSTGGMSTGGVSTGAAATGAALEADPFDPRFAQRSSGLLRDFNRAGVLSAADVHVARRLGLLSGERNESVLLGVALAVRGPRLGHVHVDLRRIRATAAVDTEEPVDLDTLAWPEPQAWVAAVAASPLVAPEDARELVRPLRLTGEWLYLDRYWAEEVQVAAALLRMAAGAVGEIDPALLEEGLERVFPGPPDGGRGDTGQRRAVAAAVHRPLAVVAGGPGTGKTTTVARIVALIGEQALAAGAPLPLVALAAPTGKAAARLQAAVAGEAAGLDVPEAIREQLANLPATTLHRLLGWRPDSNSRFRHHRQRRLPHDLVIVDETSMVSLSLMARLLEALRSEARLVLVGDPAQLASIEAGAVLGDIVGPAAGRDGAAGMGAAAGLGGGDGLAAGIVVLSRGHRFGAGIGELAGAIRAGDADAVIALLRDPPAGVRWLEADIAEEPDLAPVRAAMLDAARRMIGAARQGEAEAALEALAGFRILCAHRRGPYGVATWTARTEGWLELELPGLATGERWYPGRPLLVTENDYELGLNNGDTGVVIQAGDRISAAFERGGAIARYSPTRLGAVDTVYAMTIHKSQGSQFDAAAVLLPDPDSRILTRELLYTAATRARHELILAGPEESIRAAVGRPVARASGLRRRLWGEGATRGK
ncbi:MAG TPA: exodeoxyribonuclease V subunit alpha [Solirubrobacteraceae bacterium]